MAPRPPATKRSEEPLLEDFDEEFEQQFLHMEDSRATPSPVHILTSPPARPSSTSQNENRDSEEMDTGDNNDIQGKLLSLRKEYKKTSVALVKAKAHSNFILSCKTKEQIPKGLRVNVTCSAFLADVTNIKAEFKETSNVAEKEYVSHLDSHYDVVVKELHQKQTLIKSTMATLQSQATKEEMQDMLKKTDSKHGKTH